MIRVYSLPDGTFSSDEEEEEEEDEEDEEDEGERKWQNRISHIDLGFKGSSVGQLSCNLRNHSTREQEMELFNGWFTDGDI